MLSSFSVFFPATPKEIDAFESQQNKGVGNAFESQQNIRKYRTHPLFLGGGGVEVQFLVFTKLLRPFQFDSFSIFFVDDLQPSCPG